jgi:predicted transcriptional regulator
VVTKDVLMSIRPEYAEAILSGSKTFELRRRRPSFAEGTCVIVYSSSPDQQLLGTFCSGAVHEGAPDELWKLVRGSVAVDRDTFDAYFVGCSRAYAIEIRRPRRLKPRRLRLRPPQSYLFLSSKQQAHRGILRWAAASAS